MTGLRIGLAGAGLMGRQHARILATSSRADLVAVSDPTSAGAELADAHRCVAYSALDAMLAAEKLDGVIIATPNALHVQHALVCIARRLPVLVEKPLGTTPQEAKQLVDAASGADVPVLVGHHRRHNPLIRAAKEALVAGRIGRIVNVHAMAWLHKPASYFEVAWRTQSGGGPVLINLIHDIDLLHHFVGPVKTVFAFTSSAERGHDVEDSAAITCQFENGALGTLSLSDTIIAPWSWELTAGESAVFPKTGEISHFIGGTNGSLEVPNLRVWHQPGGGDWTAPIERHQLLVAHGASLTNQLDNFADVIEGTDQPLVTAQDGLKAVQFVDAIHRSAATRMPVDI